MKNVKGGLHLIHPWNITVNDNSKIGERVTLFKGCTIGVIEGGQKSGSPTIGDDVIVCANATVCGNISIGSHSVLAAGSFTNFDVPPYSVVIGNPGVIHRNKHDL